METVLGVAGGALLLVAVAVAVAFNRLVRARNMVSEAWSGMEVQLKRRHELVPSLVAVVRGYADFEKGVLEGTTRLRSGAAAAQGSGAGGPAATQAALAPTADAAREENAFAAEMRSVLVTVESYPDLKASESFQKLFAELVNTEEQLQYARRYYSGSVRDLNILVDSFPSNLVAGAFGFKKAEPFEVSSAVERAAPRVELG